MQTAEPVRRTQEIEDVTNLYFIHPISSACTRFFAACNIKPNAVSLAGMLFGILAGVAYNHYQSLGWTCAGFALMIAWHVMDGADGQLARLTNAQSQSGKVLDGICDYVTFIAVYTGLALALSRQYGAWIWWLAAAAGLCHAIQAAAYEVQRQEYNFWGWERKSAELMELNAPPPAAATSQIQRLADTLLRQYTRLQFLAAGVTVEFHNNLGATLAAQPGQAADIRRRYRETFAPTVRQWSILSSNYRTLGIFICAALQAPWAYFVLEIVALSTLLARLLTRQHRLQATFVAGLRGE